MKSTGFHLVGNKALHARNKKASQNFGLFGTMGHHSTDNDSQNNAIEKQLKQYKHAVIVAPKTIEIESLVEDECEMRYKRSKTISGSKHFAWIESVEPFKPEIFTSRFLQQEIWMTGKYRRQFMKEIKDGEFQICDGASIYNMRFKFK